MELMTLVAIFHVFIAIALIFLVLIQDPKGGGAAGVFGGGGSQNSFFGATGAGNFLTTLTKWLAVIFAVTSIGMTYMTSHTGSSVMDRMVPEASAPVDKNPMTAPADETQNTPEKSDSNETSHQ
ncbi:MAG: preprotein translocase subunit SecG [Bdellovibrionales bacterium]|nr:preprotein translocase subunit SecG [Bdellovibrionales bacterium]